MNHDLMLTNDKAPSSFSLRDLLAVGFRHKRTAMLCFFGILLGAILFVVFGAARYTATAKFLVDRERMDPVVSPEQTNPVMMRTPVTEEELNSEIELLQSRDVLRQVVIACGLNNHKSVSEYVFGPATAEVRIEKATNRLQSALDIAAGKKSDLIEVSYTSDSAQLAAHVLQALGDAYIQKHSAVHTPPGQAQFFDNETARYKKNLSDAEAQLKQFSTEQNGVAPTVARDLFLQKLTEFHLSLQQTRALLASTEERIKTLQKQAGITPERLTTEMKQEDDAQVLQGLKNTLMTLELKRTELLTKYQPSYPLVMEVEKQITDTKASIATEETKPIKAQTTDRNPTFAWVDAELAKAKADYSGLKAQEAAMQGIVEKYETQARDLAQKGLIEQNLVRNYKAEEENYLLYLRKGEEARMTDALDKTRIVNVAIAETPTAPSLPAHSAAFFLLVGILVAGTVSLGAVFAQEYLDPSFRTPTEVSAELNIPVLAAVPNEFDTVPGNGMNSNGSGRGREYSRSVAPTPISPVGQTGTH
jgi:uncharacterized protein involved in exopolysaccharide biosynthesis